MGYTTEFKGSFELDKALAREHLSYLQAFADSRRMKRDPAKCGPDPKREAAGLPLGLDAAYFVGGGGFAGQDRDGSILDYNREPDGQPGLWCKWEPNAEGTAIVWNGAEKFYDYIEWIEYLVTHFLKPWGYVANGSVTWQGEEIDDRGQIKIKNNIVAVARLK